MQGAWGASVQGWVTREHQAPFAWVIGPSSLKTMEDHGNPYFIVLAFAQGWLLSLSVTSQAGCMPLQVFRQVWATGAGLLLHGQPLTLHVLPQRCILACGAPGGQAVKARP